MAHGMNVTKAKGADGRGRLAQPWPRPTDPAATPHVWIVPAEGTRTERRRARTRPQGADAGGATAGSGPSEAAGRGEERDTQRAEEHKVARNERAQGAPHAGTPPPRARGEGWATQNRPHGYLWLGF